MATQYIDFAELKTQVNISQAVHMLGLRMKTNGSQMRGECPWCRAGGDRALAVNLDRQAFYCFSAKQGGDVISLVAHIKQVSQRDAAQMLATHFRFAGTGPTGASSGTGAQGSRTAPPAPRKTGFDTTAYLQNLDPNAEALQPLGVSPETLKEWKAGYAKSGVLRGKLAIALCDREGNILGFAGRALDSPQLTFPNGLEAKDIIFGQDRVPEGEVRLLREPIEVLQAYEVGEAAVCFMSTEIEPQQFEMLASLLDARKAHIIL